MVQPSEVPAGTADGSPGGGSQAGFLTCRGPETDRHSAALALRGQGLHIRSWQHCGRRGCFPSEHFRVLTPQQSWGGELSLCAWLHCTLSSKGSPGRPEQGKQRRRSAPRTISSLCPRQQEGNPLHSPRMDQAGWMVSELRLEWGGLLVAALSAQDVTNSV